MSRLALCCPGYSTTSLECGGCSLLLELGSLQSLCSTFSSTMSLWKGHLRILRIPRIGRWFSIQGGKGQRDRGWRKPERRRERGSRARIPLVNKVVRGGCQGRNCGERTYNGKDTKDQANISIQYSDKHVMCSCIRPKYKDGAFFLGCVVMCSYISPLGCLSLSSLSMIWL